MIGKRFPIVLGRSSQVSGPPRPSDARDGSVAVVPRSSRTPASGQIPGLVEHHEPLAPGERHVDPAEPHGRPRRRDPGYQPWFAWRVPMVVYLMPAMALGTIWVAIELDSPRPLLAALPWTATAVVAQRALTRRDDLRFGGQMLLALLLIFAGILAPAI
jgi:hypothetical protein